jgi:hypothetical protein
MNKPLQDLSAKFYLLVLLGINLMEAYAIHMAITGFF